MTDAISQYGRLNQSDNTVRSSADKVNKKASTTTRSPSSEASDKSAGNSAVSRGGDTVSLSNVAQKAVTEPEFDRAKVEAIKQAIAEGQYPLDAKRIAESFVALERMIR
jgi:negative regulator of flagellin synthesis FlgM